MANVDQPKGFVPVGHLFLPTMKIQAHEYTLTASATIYEGDVVTMTSDGTITAAAADDGIVVIGVAAQYAVAPATGITKVMVYDDPCIIFAAQVATGTAPAATWVGGSLDHVATHSGSATTKQSGHELDGTSIAAGTLQFKIMGLVDVPGNAWGEHAKLRVLFNEHFYKAAVTGV